MFEKLEQIQHQAMAALESASDEASLEAWRVAHLGRSAPLMQVFDLLGSLPKEERPLIGPVLTRRWQI